MEKRTVFVSGSIARYRDRRSHTTPSLDVGVIRGRVDIRTTA